MALFTAITTGLGIANSLGLFGDGKSTNPDIPAFTAQRTPTSQEAQDVLKAAGFAANFNAGEGADQALQVSEKFNTRILADVMNSIGEQFGGEIPNQEVNQVLQNQLAGKLSPATRRLLSSRAANSGAAALGKSAVYDVNSALLGQTTEQQVDKGVQNYQGLYSLYRQSVNPFRPNEALQYTGITPGAVIQGALAGSQQQFAYEQQAYNASIGQATAQATGNQQFWGGVGALGQGLTGGFGAVNAAQKKAGKNNSISDPIGTFASGVSQGVQGSQFISSLFG